jgi:tRNA (guanine-N7-)-methyltransferase
MIASSSPPHGQRQFRLYGRRRGRALRTRQQELIETLLPKLQIALDPASPLDPSLLFEHEIGEVWLEAGFGGGEHVAYQAAAHPRVGIIGCEVFEPGIARLLGLVSDQRLGNVRFFADDARLLIATLRPQSLSRAFILFPDPWPKERHKKRRLVSTETLDALAQAMSDEAELRIATDDADYAQWIAERLEAHPLFAPMPVAPRPEDWPPTRYEKKALAQGRAARLFLCRRRAR